MRPRRQGRTIARRRAVRGGQTRQRAAALANEDILIEKYIAKPRQPIEMQVFGGDGEGQRGVRVRTECTAPEAGTR